MIRIMPVSENRNKKEILDLYYRMIAEVTPFYNEDIFYSFDAGEDGGYLSIPKKKPRRKTKKYKEVLEKYGINESDREKRDAMLAKEIISKASPALSEFLYQGAKDGHVNKENLNKLLMVSSDKLICKNTDYEFSDLEFDTENADDLLDYVFRYKAFADHSEINNLIRLLGVSVCPYCNRTYVITLIRSEGKVRAQLDHYKNKSQYPYLALSLYNLVPSCSTCNQAKSDRDELVLYPYAEEMGENYVFTTEPDGGIRYLIGENSEQDKFTVIGKHTYIGDNSEYKQRLDNSIKIFHLEELYREHKDYVLDMYRQRYIFSDEYLETLCKRFPELFKSIEEAKNLLYLNDIGRENWGNRPLAKLTHDIDKEITRLNKR